MNRKAQTVMRSLVTLLILSVGAVVAEEAASLLQRAISERRVHLHIAPDLPTVRGDRTRLLQVLQNLLDNAVRFLGDQAEPRIEVGWRRDGEDQVCFVRDNGIGIEAGNRERVFELFRRAHDGSASNDRIIPPMTPLRLPAGREMDSFPLRFAQPLPIGEEERE